MKKDDERITAKAFLLIFILGVATIFGPYFLFFDREKNLYNAPSNLYYTIADSLKKTASADLGMMGDSYNLSGCRQCSISPRFGIDSNESVMILDYELSHKSYLWRQFHKIPERMFGIPIDFGWVQISKNMGYADLSSNKGISITARNAGNIEVSVIEGDGDIWVYTKNGDAKEGWDEINISFSDFALPEWSCSGNGKREFSSVNEIKLTIADFEGPVKGTLVLKMQDGEIFKVI